MEIEAQKPATDLGNYIFLLTQFFINCDLLHERNKWKFFIKIESNVIIFCVIKIFIENLFEKKKKILLVLCKEIKYFYEKNILNFNCYFDLDQLIKWVQDCCTKELTIYDDRMWHS